MFDFQILNMPLLITEKEIDWCETENNIKILVPLKSRINSKTTVFAASQYLKISSPPWIWECFIAFSINPLESNIIIEENQVSIELRKNVPKIWNILEDENKGNETFRKKRRDQAFEENKKRLEAVEESNAAKKQEIHRASVRKQMQLDDKERAMIEKEKKAESERVALELERMRKEQQKANKIALERKKLQDMSRALPPTRKTGHITVSFTPRVFPTAARESQEADEKEWLEKQAAASIKLKLDCNDLTEQERNPEWLKRKAESLFKKEDYHGAINAYSLAIRMCPNMYSLYLGRSTCHLRLRNLHKCIEDSSKALELLTPPVPSNADDRLEVHKIRGMAFQKLDLPLEGLMDFEAALKINPRNEDLKQNADNLRKIIENAEDVE